MATAANPITENVGSLSTEKVTYRMYIKGEGENQVVKVQSEVQAKDSKTGLSANWQKLENDGYVLATENEFTRYSIKSEEGFKALVPNETQRLYIAQAGLNYLQNAKAANLMTAVNESDPEKAPLYNQETIDLREAINEPVTRKSLTDMEKLEKTLALLNLTPDQKADLLLTLAKSQAVAEEV